VRDIGPFLKNGGRIFEIVPADRGMIAARRGRVTAYAERHPGQPGYPAAAD